MSKTKVRSSVFEVSASISEIESNLMGITSQYKIFPTYVSDYSGLNLYLRNSITLQWRDEITVKEKEAIINRFGLVESSETRLWNTYDVENPLIVSHSIYESGLVNYCEPDFISEIVEHSNPPTDPYYADQWYLNTTGGTDINGQTISNNADINAPEAWVNSKGTGVKVAVISWPGVLDNHPDLPASSFTIPTSSLFPSGYSYAPVGDDAHGTEVAGIIGARENNVGIVGVAPECSIMPFRLNGDLKPETAFIIATDNGAQVINCSWGMSSPKAALTSAIQDAICNGVVVVFSASNSGTNVSYPANAGLGGLIGNPYNTIPILATKLPLDIIVVGASTRENKRASYSPTSNRVDIVAPSGDVEGYSGNIYTTDLVGNLGVNPTAVSDPTNVDYDAHFSGTSASTPMVAGVVALMLQINPNLTVSEVRDILFSKATPLSGENYVGAGRVNAEDAVNETIAYTSPSTTSTVIASDKTIFCDMTVETGELLTIKDCKLNFAPNVKIIVERGAKLVVDNSILTSFQPFSGTDFYWAWSGIEVEGNNNMVQPNYNDPFPGISNQAGIVIVKNGSRIEAALTGISAVGSTGAFSGGLVHCENSTFYANNIGASFGNYNNFQNKSKFLNCTFKAANSKTDGSTTVFDGAVGSHVPLSNIFTQQKIGVKIISTDGILFQHCEFYEFQDSGLKIFDSGVDVSIISKFNDCGDGISIQATYPYASNYYSTIGDLYGHVTNSNIFQFNTNAIYSTSSKLKVFQNKFKYNITCIRLAGENSNFDVSNNDIQSSNYNIGVSIFNTGGNYNYVRSNTIHSKYGIIVTMNNNKFRFLCNNFNCSRRDFWLKGWSWDIPSNIRYTQGSYWYPAENCFTRPIPSQGDIKTTGLTSPFYYYYHNTSCKNPISSGNYTKTATWREVCNATVSLPPNEGTSYNLSSINDDLSALISSNASLELIDSLNEVKNEMLETLVLTFAQNNQISEAIGILNQESSAKSKLMKFGVYLNANDYVNAKLALSEIPSSIPDYNDFVGIQKINLNRLMQSNFKLSDSEYDYLLGIALSPSASRFYARAILNLLLDEKYYDDLEELFDLDGQFRKKQDIGSIEEKIQISPNPVNDILTISFSKAIHPVSLKVISIVGNTILENSNLESEIINISSENWQPGIYFIEITDTFGEKYTKKIIKN